MDKERVLVIDIECASPHDINSPEYIPEAVVKFVSVYSYKDKQPHVIRMRGERERLLLLQLFRDHEVVVGFNSKDFDIPILKNTKNNAYVGKHVHVDLQQMLHGRMTKDGRVNGRGSLMGYDFPGESLRTTAQVMKVETMKDEIDHAMWAKEDWTAEELAEIKRYCIADIMATKEIFDKCYDYWLPFTQFLGPRNVTNWSWMTSGTGSLAYKWFCQVTGKEEVYGEKGPHTDGGGRVIEPRVSEAWDVIYVDVVSLYPHIYAMFDLFTEVTDGTTDAWHGNEMFKVNGYYRNDEQSKMAAEVARMLVERVKLKKWDPKNPLIYTYKILLNSLYGANRSSIFTNLYTPNSGADCCYLGRQVNEVMEREMTAKGYEVIAGDTDSNFIRHKDGKVSYEKVTADLREVVQLILKNVPHPIETFDIAVEAMIDYIAFNTSKIKGKTLKKNYVYIKSTPKGRKVVVMGLPIIKSTASALGPLIFEKHLKQKILDENKSRFEPEWLMERVREELKLELLAQEYRCNSYDFYSEPGKKSLPAQISREYMGGKGGRIVLIKNRKLGRVGSSWKYAPLEEAQAAGITVDDLDLTKVLNELSPFCTSPLTVKNTKPQKKGSFDKAPDDAPVPSADVARKLQRGAF